MIIQLSQVTDSLNQWSSTQKMALKWLPVDETGGDYIHCLGLLGERASPERQGSLSCKVLIEDGLEMGIHWIHWGRHSTFIDQVFWETQLLSW